MTYLPLSRAKSKTTLSRLWQVLASDGLPPYKAIEQVSYLLVIKQMGQRDAGTGPLQWRALQAVPDEHLMNAMSEAVARLRDTTPFERAQLSISKSPLLREAMTLIDELFPATCSPEQHAQVYDALLRLAEEAARAWATPGGKFYSPHQIAHLLCSLVRPQVGERICDPACGNGRLLASAYAHIVRLRCNPDELRFAADGQPLPLEAVEWMGEQTRLVGLDIDESATLQAWVLLRCLGIGEPSIHTIDTLSTQVWDCLGHEEGFDVLLANPPFSARIDEAALDKSLRSLQTLKAELLFISRALQLLRPGGRAAIIVPDSVLFHQSKAAVSLRRTLVTKHRIHAIISLPKGVFAPETDVKTSIIVLTHSGETDTIWCYDVQHDGYSLDKCRQPTPEQNDLPDLLIKYSLRFARTLSAIRPSAFIDDDTELQWSNVAWPSYSYAQPLIGNAPQAFLKTLALPITQPKDWEIRIDQLDEHCILLPVRYQPRDLESRRPGFPPEMAVSLGPKPSGQSWTQVSDWYAWRLQGLREIYRQGHINAKQHLAALRLFAARKHRLERRLCTPFHSPHW